MANKSKKIRNARIIATDIFMFIAVIAIVFLMMLIAMGYKFNEEGDLEQSGLLQLSSRPSSAKVTIDGDELLMPTSINKLLGVGEHNIKVTKTGYDTWNSKVNIESGLLTEIGWVRLFPLNPAISDVDTFETMPQFVSTSNSRRYMIAGVNGEDHFDLLSLQEEKIKSTTINLSNLVKLEGRTINPSDFKTIAWSENDSRILMNYNYDGNIDWIVLNINKPSESLNLTSQFGRKFANISFANNAGTKAWALSNGQLFQLDLSNGKTISEPIAENVNNYKANNDTVAYIAKSSEYFLDDDDRDKDAIESDSPVETNKVFIYNEGEESSTIIADLGSLEAGSFLEMGTYWSKDWLVYSKNGQLCVRSGIYPSYNKNTLKDFPILKKIELEETPTTTATNPDNRIIMLASREKILTFDLETKSTNNYSADDYITQFNWLDDYLLWQQLDSKLIVWDFDGNNHRELIQNLAGNQPVLLSQNNKYLYYFTSETIQQKPSAADLQQNPNLTENDLAPITTYHLTRMELNI